jgi:transposase
MQMSLRQAKRLEAIGRVTEGLWTMAVAAAAVGVSVRQLRRLCRNVEARGASGLLHGNRGKKPANKHVGKTTRRVVELARKKYAGFNDHHLTEKLADVEHLAVGRSTVSRWLRAAGLGPVRKRRSRRHRRRRDRKAQAGLMIQWDGSHHDWLEGRGPWLSLVGAIDDATGEFLPGALFAEQECTAAYLHVLREMLRAKGCPWSCYGDRHGIFRRNDDHWTLEEELRGAQDPTQLGRALDGLGIERIDALSFQAKGRVERMWLTHQDRLVSELRLAKASSCDEANVVLARYRHDHNRRFVVKAANAEPAWRKVAPGLDLERVISFRYDSTVRNDNTVRFEGVLIDIPPGPGGRSYAQARVEVRQLLDGRWRVYLGDQRIATATPTPLGDLRPRKSRKRPAASMAFRAAVMAMRT